MIEPLGVFVASTLRLATPLVLGAAGEVVSERAGVLNLSLEGMMLSGAFAAALGAHATGSPLAGVAFGVLSALVIAAAQAWLSVHAGADQLVVGIGINLLALGATTFAYRELFGGLSREVIPSFEVWAVPGLAALPLVGPALFQQTPLVYVALALTLFSAWLVNGTAFGLALRAAGEDPRAADQAGVPVARVRVLCVLYTGGCAGLAGAFLAVSSISTFTEGMTSGAGYLAVAAVILGAWRTSRVLCACLLFGGATALQFLLPALGLALPTALLLMLPYLLALAAVSGVVGRSRPPAALTLPFRRGCSR